MPEEPTESRLGDPFDSPPLEKETAVNRGKTPLSDSINRDGDSGIGIIDQNAEITRELSQEETETHQQKIEDDLREEASNLLEQIEKGNGWQIPQSIRRVLNLILIGIAAVLGIFLINQTTVFIERLDTLPQWSRIIAIISLCGFGLIILYIIGSLLKAVITLRRSPQINATAVRQLSERQHMQQFAAEKNEEAKESLLEYLYEYPTTSEQFKKLKPMGCLDKDWSEIQRHKKDLIDSAKKTYVNDWVLKFTRTFQGELDAIASKRIKAYAVRVGMGTAASPIPILDRMIMLYGALKMIEELCHLYNLRPAYGQSATLLAKAIMITYLSGLLDEGADQLGEMATDFVGDKAGGIGIDLLGKLGAKTAEGSLNGLLIYRLGKRTAKMLKPTL